MHMYGFWLNILLALFSFLAITVFTSMRYVFLISSKGERLSHLHSFLVQEVVRFSCLVVPFKMGTLLSKPAALKYLAGIKVKKSLPSIFFEHVFDLTWEVVSLPFMIFFISETRLIGSTLIEVLALVVLLGTSLLLFKKRKYVISKAWKLKRHMPGKFRSMGAKYGFTNESLDVMFSDTMSYFSEWRLLLKISVPTVAFILISPLTIYFCGLAFSVTIDYRVAFLVYWASATIGRISGIPDGYGTKDLSMAGFLVFFGVSPAQTIPIVLAWRLLGMLPAIAMGAPLSFFIGRNVQKKYLKKGKD